MRNWHSANALGRRPDVPVAQFVAQLREGLKQACDADSSAHGIYWYGYELEDQSNAPFDRSKNVVQMLESSDKLHTKSEK